MADFLFCQCVQQLVARLALAAAVAQDPQSLRFQEAIMSEISVQVPGRALRLTLRVRGSNVELVRQERLGMAVLPSLPAGFGADRSGFWFELRSVGGQPLYRMAINDPLSDVVEVRGDDPNGPLTNVPAPRQNRIFSIVVPHAPDGTSVASCRAGPIKPTRLCERTAPCPARAPDRRQRGGLRRTPKEGESRWAALTAASSGCRTCACAGRATS